MGAAVGKTFSQMDHVGGQFFRHWGDRVVAAGLLYLFFRWQMAKRFPKAIESAQTNKQEHPKQEHSKQE